MKLNSRITLIVTTLILATAGWYAFAQPSKSVRPSSSPPKLPMSIPPPNFGSFANKTGKFQLVSAEYYSQDEKPYLYKRLIKFDTTTGEGWVLYSKLDSSGERRTWVPLVKDQWGEGTELSRNYQVLEVESVFCSKILLSLISIPSTFLESLRFFSE